MPLDRNQRQKVESLSRHVSDSIYFVHNPTRYMAIYIINNFEMMLTLNYLNNYRASMITCEDYKS